MHIQIVWAAVLVCLFWSADAAWQLGMKEQFVCSPQDGAACTWAECRQGGGGKRLFQVRCQPPQGQTYGCIYKGNPHECAAYNNNGQRNFYISLAKKAAQNRPHGCSYWKIWSSSMCKEITMVREYKRVPAPDWCVEQ